MHENAGGLAADSSDAMPYQIDAPIRSHARVGEFEYEMRLHAPAVAREAAPGQFVQVRYGDLSSPFCRRPFSIFHTDRESGEFTIAYLVRGGFTAGMRGLAEGQMLSVVGPLGNRLVADPRPDLVHVLVAGGVGAPPLYFLAREMLATGTPPDAIRVINGARSREHIVARREFAALGVPVTTTTDDGSEGRKGIVTHALRDLLPVLGSRGRVATCGPTDMMRAVAGICREHDVPCTVSVETVMPCGLGVCMGCVVKRRDPSTPEGFAYVRACHEGPVFDAGEVIWD
ncbi:MAG TPA: dihydroorotate dehydrogenase electron transfer subunit [Chthonomonadales bacterium]|nr:dihydroorotate dehydrogenase electron transfer subunit [Chthonomonadales bacterium]